MIEVNGIDFTECVQETTYKVDEQDVFTKWTDANGVDHRKVIRQRITGSFDLVFIEGYKKTYTEFMEAVKAAKTDGALEITLSVNNLDEVKTISCFYSIKFKAPQKIAEGRTFRKCTFTLEER